MMILHPVIGFYQTLFALLLIFSGGFQVIRWLRWRPWITLSVPLLWSLHFALKFIGFGLILLGISYLITGIQSSPIWHLLTIGGMGGLILAMISRVSLGHTGRPLTPPKLMSVAFILISISAMVRAFGPILLPAKTMIFIDISAFCWIGAFLIFVINYGPMLCKTRIDDRPG
jgi:uncharacterized protein involved in response to NO